MAKIVNSTQAIVPAGFFARLLCDRAGNTLALIAAALLPLLALVGGGIDMGRSYLAQARLQQACDAGVLAARKKLGSQSVSSGTVPSDVAAIGERFFNLNFQNGSYGTRDRSFAMALEQDYSISGTASVDVPTTIMTLFGYSDVPIAVDCQARLNFSNTDVMFVLDTTGSMAWANPGDTQPKIEVLRSVVKSFHSQLEASKTPGTRIRYGFVPYSTNVNVGYLLKSDWVVDSWDYHGRVSKETGKWETYNTYNTTYTYVSGTANGIAATTGTSCPASTAKWTTISYWTSPDGSVHAEYEVTGDSYSCTTSSDGSLITITGTHYDHYRYKYDSVFSGTASREIYNWQYKPVTIDVRFLKGATGDAPLKGGSIDVPMYGYPSPTPTNMTAYFRGCMEERDTYEIDDYANVDLTRALDLDIDLVPTAGDPATQWRPMLNEISWEPEIWWNGSGTFKTSPVLTSNDYLMAEWAGLSACPARAQKLQEMTDAQVSTYVDSLFPEGSTYHDIGMIWGGRLLSPTGLFASENADVGGKPTSRHLIFLTDGETAPLDLSYGTYGIEPFDQRRWSQKSSLSQTSVVEKRFGVACDEVKKRNITVWIIGFGTSLNPVMTQCAGAGHYFEAKDSAELNDVFSKIAAQLGDLRITK
ncbi:pilus assembly protein TadG-related protein [Novosphingobium sp.]|uniref:pilus assembly protein TadG-related protein n=1 Tax=Novosphingobium sp. TaxID=1874826 RepID=UPI0035ADE64A